MHVLSPEISSTNIIPGFVLIKLARNVPGDPEKTRGSVKVVKFTRFTRSPFGGPGRETIRARDISRLLCGPRELIRCHQATLRPETSINDVIRGFVLIKLHQTPPGCNTDSPLPTNGPNPPKSSNPCIGAISEIRGSNPDFVSDSVSLTQSEVPRGPQSFQS